MSDNKRECEIENGVSENPTKKQKIELENGENGVEIKDKFVGDNGNVSLNNGNHEQSPVNSVKKPEENGFTEVENEKKVEEEDNDAKELNSEHDNKVKDDEKSDDPREPSGELLFAGCCNWDLVGRRKLPKDGKNIGPNLWGPHRLESMKGVKIRHIASGASAAHSVIIDESGQAYTWGRNECGQLGHGDIKRREIPTLLDCLSGINIVSAACGKNHTILLSDTGRVFTMGDNKCGQLGLGNTTSMIPSPTQISNSGPPFCRVSAGGEFSMMVDIKGNLFSFGSPEYGQLGHNTDGKYFVTSNKQAFNYDISPRKVSVFIEKTRDGRVNMISDVVVKEVFCGPNHTVAVDQKRRVYSWGFGGYGRLGHNEPKDELVPRLIKTLEGKNITAVGCGTSYSLAHTDAGVLYFWGLAKPTGEATMYPKLVPDLTGWKVRSIGAGHRSICVAADDDVVSWGPSPTYGELALGDHKKSSTVPVEVKTLNNVYVHKVAMGMGHCLMIARNDTQEERDRLDKIPTFRGVS